MQVVSLDRQIQVKDNKTISSEIFEKLISGTENSGPYTDSVLIEHIFAHYVGHLTRNFMSNPNYKDLNLRSEDSEDVLEILNGARYKLEDWFAKNQMLTLEIASLIKSRYEETLIHCNKIFGIEVSHLIEQ